MTRSKHILYVGKSRRAPIDIHRQRTISRDECQRTDEESLYGLKTEGTLVVRLVVFFSLRAVVMKC